MTQETNESTASGDAVEHAQYDLWKSVKRFHHCPEASGVRANIDALIAAVRARARIEIGELKAELAELRGQPAVQRKVVAMTSHGDRVLIAYDDGSFECGTVPLSNSVFEPGAGSDQAVSKSETTEEER